MVSAQKKVLLVGDSMSSYMGQTLESICAGTEVFNAGIGGTTAQEWASYSSNVVNSCGGGPWNVVYISVGGNDFLQSGCTISMSELIKNVENSVVNIVTNIAPGAEKYLMTGYCMPTASTDGCGTPTDFSSLSIAIQNISPSLPNGVDFEVIESQNVCGGDASTFSNSLYFQDVIHLNSKGYCAIFTQPRVQNVLSCENASTDLQCETYTTPIYGLEQNCANDDPETLPPMISPTNPPTGESPNYCVDSELPFLVNSRKRKCSWVAQKNTSMRCGKARGEVSKHCPLTCGVCQEYACVDATKRFYLKNGNLKSCAWVRRVNSLVDTRCSKEGVGLTCRASCENNMCQT